MGDTDSVLMVFDIDCWVLDLLRDSARESVSDLSQLEDAFRAVGTVSDLCNVGWSSTSSTYLLRKRRRRRECERRARGLGLAERDLRDLSSFTRRVDLPLEEPLRFLDLPLRDLRLALRLNGYDSEFSERFRVAMFGNTELLSVRKWKEVDMLRL